MMLTERVRAIAAQLDRESVREHEVVVSVRLLVETWADGLALEAHQLGCGPGERTYSNEVVQGAFQTLELFDELARKTRGVAVPAADETAMRLARLACEEVMSVVCNDLAQGGNTGP